jgi:hypothetical protein
MITDVFLRHPTSCTWLYQVSADVFVHLYLPNRNATNYNSFRDKIII